MKLETSLLYVIPVIPCPKTRDQNKLVESGILHIGMGPDLGHWDVL